ncbi:hypothetical protein BDF19DRAFT_424606 [Syncephalis fuscata]|nr:hypothetical protein BDF19DRAFT_424606 [Syncephalis fuscata]
MQQGTYAAHAHHTPFSSARPPLDASPNARSNYSHYGPNHPHDTTATNTTAATAAPPTAAPAPPSHVTRPMNAEGYSHTTSVPYGANHPSSMIGNGPGGDSGHSMHSSSTYTTFRVEDHQHVSRRQRTASFGGKSPSPPMHPSAIGNNGTSMIPSKRPASMLAPAATSAAEMTMSGLMPSVSPRPIPLNIHGQHSDDSNRLYARDPAFHRMMPATTPTSSTLSFQPTRPQYQPLTPSQSGSLLPPNNASPPISSASARRAAQNRAAQRAFRQRKERYMKELEYKSRVLVFAQQRLAERRGQVKRLQELAKALYQENNQLRSQASNSVKEEGNRPSDSGSITDNDDKAATDTAMPSSLSRLLADTKMVEELLESEPADIDEDLIHPPAPVLPFPELDMVQAPSQSVLPSSSSSSPPSSISMLGGNSAMPIKAELTSDTSSHITSFQ